MTSVAEAQRLVLATARPLPPETVPLLAATGRTLRQNLTADRDFPPFHRVAMDGIALAFEAVAGGQISFPIEATQFAGAPPQPLQNPRAAVEIMTGAVLPPGTDTVVRYEDVSFEEVDGQRVATVHALPERMGHNVHARAADRRQGDLLLPAGTRLGPAEIAVATTIGAATLSVTRPARLAIVSTGDELVDIAEQPLPHQIRRSNAAMLQAAAQAADAVTEAFHFNDNQDILRQGLPALLRRFDAVVLSGGVSKGQADFLPSVLRELGVEQIFHEVEQRPGKPFWFGQMPGGVVVFALPGNPVSTFVNYYRYVQPWLRACQAPEMPPAPAAYAVLAEAVSFRPRLTYFLPVRLDMAPDGRLLAHPQRAGGSGDLASLLHCDGFLELPPEQTEFAAGEAWPLLRFRE
ncbi:molybdenum cofactor synthesis domain protein [Hymenobacter roseosalivarius DSM 11622]|uniref:Molybdopterin molybdenumtransferase n=1 Tax=Hymenobacter roseosalivarius DSM 11622 TaxID=645990 RepID=A0A1W1UUY4_9BACT|nr:molybdopterin molybdotransferase MoeA [Hymenobacter roseosalivarius]SMB84836.1 molybdenum cofactor synthesis domain protein [Hymenobacter roseosalivarius DSM 11622]